MGDLQTYHNTAANTDPVNWPAIGPRIYTYWWQFEATTANK
jgi:hypothetical protein